MASTEFLQYASKCFTILETTQPSVSASILNERTAAELVLKQMRMPTQFLCVIHQLYFKSIHIKISNIFFDNKQNIFSGIIRKDGINQFKQRLRKRMRDEAYNGLSSSEYSSLLFNNLSINISWQKNENVCHCCDS